MLLVSLLFINLLFFLCFFFLLTISPPSSTSSSDSLSSSPPPPSDETEIIIINVTLSLSMIANNSPYSLLCNLYDVSSENLVLDQLWYSTLLSLLVGLTLSPVILKGDPVLVTHQGLFKGSTHLFVIPATCKRNVVICSEFLV